MIINEIRSRVNAVKSGNFRGTSRRVHVHVAGRVSSLVSASEVSLVLVASLLC